MLLCPLGVGSEYPARPPPATWNNHSRPGHTAWCWWQHSQGKAGASQHVQAYHDKQAHHVGYLFVTGRINLSGALLQNHQLIDFRYYRPMLAAFWCHSGLHVDCTKAHSLFCLCCLSWWLYTSAIKLCATSHLRTLWHKVCIMTMSMLIPSYTGCPTKVSLEC